MQLPRQVYRHCSGFLQPGGVTDQPRPRRAGSRPARRGRPRAAPRSARAVPEHALELVARPAQGARAARCRRGARSRRRPRRPRRSTPARPRPPASGDGRSTTRAQQRGAGEVGGQQRRHQVRAAAVVLLGGVARVGRRPARRRRSPCARRRGRRRGRRRAAPPATGASESAAAAASPPTPRARRRSASRRRAVARHRDEHVASWKGSRASRQRALDQRDHRHRLAQADHAARAGERVDAPRTRGLGPEATAIAPSAARTAAAQCVGPWTSRPLRSAMPPRRSFSGSQSSEQLPRTSRKKRAANPRSRTSDALVGECTSGAGLVERHLAPREEAVGDALGEGGAERARVGEAGQHRRDDARLGVLALDPAARCASISGESAGEPLPTTFSVNSSS